MQILANPAGRTEPHLPIDQVCLNPTGTAACLQGRDHLFILDLSEDQPIDVEAWTGCHLDPEEGTIRVNSQGAP